MSKSKLISFILLIVIMICSNSCVVEGGCDLFRNTKWECNEYPLGPLDAEIMTVQFLANNVVILNTVSQTTSKSISGTYLHNDRTAILNDLSFEIDNTEITFIEVHYNNDVAFILWRAEGILMPFTTALHRN